VTFLPKIKNFLAIFKNFSLLQKSSKHPVFAHFVKLFERIFKKILFFPHFLLNIYKIAIIIPQR